jgi:hypothetical protein
MVFRLMPPQGITNENVPTQNCEKFYNDRGSHVSNLLGQLWKNPDDVFKMEVYVSEGG